MNLAIVLCSNGTSLSNSMEALCRSPSVECGQSGTIVNLTAGMIVE
jgi:hypothetical protein